MSKAVSDLKRVGVSGSLAKDGALFCRSVPIYLRLGIMSFPTGRVTTRFLTITRVHGRDRSLGPLSLVSGLPLVHCVVDFKTFISECHESFVASRYVRHFDGFFCLIQHFGVDDCEVIWSPLDGEAVDGLGALVVLFTRFRATLVQAESLHGGVCVEHLRGFLGLLSVVA